MKEITFKSLVLEKNNKYCYSHDIHEHCLDFRYSSKVLLKNNASFPVV